MTVLITGGAGYIGSHTVRRLLDEGERVAVLDDLSTGHRAAVPAAATLHVADLRDCEATRAVFETVRPESVVHFAAATSVAESESNPQMYTERNVRGTENLLAAMVESGVGRIVFSSTAAVYGAAPAGSLTEATPRAPINHYGRTKAQCEDLLERFGTEHGIRSVMLRYFNAAGAHPCGDLGEDHSPETHLIPIVLQAALGQRTGVKIYGSDYPTRDGTCIRDYVHVDDLADAHIRSLRALRENRFTRRAFNLGSEGGHSVREVIDAARCFTARPIEVGLDARRPGDPPVLVACAARARRELGWRPAPGGLERIIETAWRWHERHPDGYRGEPLAETVPVRAAHTQNSAHHPTSICTC